MIDSHCHLDTSVWGTDAVVDQVIARAHAAGVDEMVTIGSGYGFDSAWRAMEVVRRHPSVRASVGLHPHDAKDFSPERFADLLALADDPRVVAIGEMGLDYHYEHSEREAQRVAFRAQLQAARSRRLPVVIHDRDSGNETLAMLDEAAAWDTGVLYHCYTGNVATMQDIVARGGYISIPGIVTFKNAGAMADVATVVPLDRLLIETDSPFLTPVPHRGKRNEPAYVTLVAAKIASLRGMDVNELDRITTDNAKRVFRWT